MIAPFPPPQPNTTHTLIVHTGIHYATGHLFDMKAITDAAHRKVGIIMTPPREMEAAFPPLNLLGKIKALHAAPP